MSWVFGWWSIGLVLLIVPQAAREAAADEVVLSECVWDGEVWACFFVVLGDDGVEVSCVGL